MKHAELVLSKSAAMERAAQSVAQADGLPDIDFWVATHADGLPMVMVHSLHAYEWANHLWPKGRWNIDPATGDVEFAGVVNGVRWSITLLLDETPCPVDWSGPVHQTMVIES